MADRQLAYAQELIHVFRQIVGAVLLSWQRVLRIGLCTGAAALVVTEVVSCLLTSSFPPPATAHLVAVALALALGYCAALTAIVALLLRGGVQFIRYLEGEAEIGTRAAAAFAGREVGDVGVGLRRILGGVRDKSAARSAHNGRTAIQRLSGTAREATRAAAASPAMAAGTFAAVRGTSPHAKSVQKHSELPLPADPPGSRRDPDDAIIKQPAPTIQSLPVLASRLPRIEWTYDDQPPLTATQPAQQPKTQPVAVPAMVGALATPMEQMTLADEQLAPTAPTTSAASTRTLEGADAAGAISDSRRTPDVPGLIPRGWQRNSPITRPMPAVTQPLPVLGDTRASGGTRSGGLWQRVSQALVGQTGTSETTPESALETAGSASATFDDQPIPASEFSGNDAWLND